MYLKSVEIVGFKSFADKTRIDLKPGINAVVGPNGCGKSNVMESVRWCIGEMSWKALRSPSMVQVIFQGTSKRSALNMAEVTLTFDNANTLLPVEYSEVTVTRRIFRSGESEYWLNKTQCRLRDIRDLFLDTGIGGEGYAIIDQGNVEYVLSAKPEDRRSLFEEAAGVARYKAKREEALRKLERVEQDMARLNDSIVLLQQQQTKLDNEARKARLFEKYKQDLVLQEGAGLVQELELLRSEIAPLDERLTSVQAQSEDARVESDRAAAELATLNIEKLEREKAVLEANQSLSTLREEAGRLDERLKFVDGKRSYLTTSAEALAKELEADQARADELRPALEATHAELAKAETDRNEVAAKLDTLTGQLEAAESRLEAVEQEYAEARKLADEAAEERQSLAQQTARTESEYVHLKAEAHAALKDLDKSEVKLAGVRETLETLRAEATARRALAEEAKAAAEAASQARRDKYEALKAAESEAADARTALAECSARLEAVVAQQAGDPTQAAAQAVIRAGLPGVLGQLRQLVDVEQGSAAVTEEALGDLLGAVVCEDLDAAHRAIEWLRDAGKGRSRFLVLSAVPEAAAPLASLPEASRALLSALRPDARVERLVRLLLTEVFVNGSTVRGPYWLSGGSDEAAPVRGYFREAELVAVRTELEVKAADVRARVDLLRSELAALEFAQRDASQARQDRESAARESELGLAERERSMRTSEEECGLILTDCRRQLASISTLLENRRALVARVAGIDGREAEAQSRLEALRSEKEKLSAEAAGVRGQYEGLAVQVRHFQSQIQSVQAKRQQLEQTLTSIEQNGARRRADREEALKSLAELEAETLAAKERLSVVGAQLADAERAVKDLLEQLDATRAEVESKEAEVSIQRSRFEGLQTQSHELQLELSGRKTREELASQRLFEQTGISFEEAKAKFEGQETSPEKIQWLRQRIEKLGNVNMTAPEEMEALKTRYDFIQSQVADLDKAKEDLRQAIAKINANTRENFRHTFDEVRGHFRRIYGVLFEGGEADLVLTDPENLLETGVDIVAQPPGKKLQAISQLSGGEKALTALALLFGFFSVKPSPFCMLDEADAALDDANVERFARLIKDFADKCQFIVISHNKRTMEIADILYGVTMEESGVSQLISVEMTKRSANETKNQLLSRAAERPKRRKPADEEGANLAVAEAATALKSADEVLKAIKTANEPKPEAAAPETETVVQPVVEAVIETVEPVVEAVIETVEPVVEAVVETVEPVVETPAETVAETLVEVAAEPAVAETEPALETLSESAAEPEASEPAPEEDAPPQAA